MMTQVPCEPARPAPLRRLGGLGGLGGLAVCALFVSAIAGCDRGAASRGSTSGSTSGSTTSATTSPSRKRAKVVFDWVAEPEFGGFYAAREGGAFARHGLEMEIIGGGPSTPVVPMVASGQVDFGTTGADGTIIARARGVDVVPLFAVYQIAPTAIMAHRSRGATTLKEVFSSGTLAVDPGLAFTLFLKKKYGFDKLKVVPYEGGLARFLVDKQFAQQCFVTSEPLAAKKQGADPIVFRIADEGFNPYATVVVTRGDLARKSPDYVRSFVAAVREGWRAYLDDPKPANAVMAKLNTSMDAETFAAVAEAQRPLIETPETKAGGLGMLSRERWETLSRQLVELGVIDKAPPVDDYLITGLNAP